MLRNRWVMAVVGVIFAAVVLYNVNFFMKRTPIGGPQGNPVASVLPAALPGAQKIAPVESRTAPAFPLPREREKWKRDPFQYKGGGAMTAAREIKKTVSLKLQGITIRDGRHFALVNGWVVEAGDMLEDVIIKEVTPYSIFVKDAAGVREIKMYTDLPDKEK